MKDESITIALAMMTYENHKGQWKTKKIDIGYPICMKCRM